MITRSLALHHVNSSAGLEILFDKDYKRSHIELQV